VQHLQQTSREEEKRTTRTKKTWVFLLNHTDTPKISHTLTKKKRSNPPSNLQSEATMKVFWALFVLKDICNRGAEQLTCHKIDHKIHQTRLWQTTIGAL
jgi:hypothetical protein